jgi:uncharacterized membrane protein YgdD (TMEM256/DUF423 family)
MSSLHSRPHLVPGLILFLAVAFGAFGAHGLKSHFLEHPDLEGVYKTAVLYHFIHGIALLWISGRQNEKWRKPRWVFFFGILIFSGSLYALVLTEIRSFGAITPIGGLLFLVGWVLVAIHPKSE